MTDLEAAREAAWREYAAAQRALPDCDHVRAWHARIDQARGKHQAAIRACDRALTADAAAAAPEAVTGAPETACAADCQEPLFDLEGAALWTSPASRHPVTWTRDGTPVLTLSQRHGTRPGRT